MSLQALIQTLGNVPPPVAYFTEQLEQTVKGWSSCLQAVVATCDRLQEAKKCTQGQSTTVFFPYHVLSLKKKKDIFNRRIIALQYCFGLCHTST